MHVKCAKSTLSSRFYFLLADEHFSNDDTWLETKLSAGPVDLESRNLDLHKKGLDLPVDLDLTYGGLVRSQSFGDATAISSTIIYRSSLWTL